MMEIEFIGLFVTTGITLIGGLSLVMKPVLKLNESITKLDDNLNHLTNDKKRQDERLDCHGHSIDALETEVARHDVRIQHLEER